MNASVSKRPTQREVRSFCLCIRFTPAEYALLRGQERERSLPGRSWVAPLVVQRVQSAHKDCEVAYEQVKLLDKRNAHAKVVVAEHGSPFSLQHPPEQAEQDVTVSVLGRTLRLRSGTACTLRN